jgi:hypothetical protein
MGSTSLVIFEQLRASTRALSATSPSLLRRNNARPVAGRVSAFESPIAASTSATACIAVVIER